MVALIVGLILIGFTVIACLPQVLGWGPDIVQFLRGGVPVLAAFTGLVAVFIGAADIKDKREAAKEEAAAQAEEEKTDKK